MANKIQIKRGIKSNLPALSVGEPAFCTDTEELYIGGNSGNVKISQSGDMTKAIYDTDNDGVVDNASALQGHDASYFETPSGAQAKIDALAGEGNTATVKAVDDALKSHLSENASLTVKGHVQLQTTVDTSETKALTPKALNNHLLNLVTDSGGVHGLQIEEGTWTPIIAGLTTAGVNTYSATIGRYKKIGNQVTCYFSVVMTAKDASMAGAVILSQLPFAIGGTINNMAGGTLAAFSNITLETGFTQLGLESAEGTPYMYLRQCGSNKIATVLDSTKIAANTEIRGEITYLI
jgi:hypothetical protein